MGFGGVMVAHHSTIFWFAKRHNTNPWSSIFCPVAASVTVHELRFRSSCLSNREGHDLKCPSRIAGSRGSRHQ